MPGIVGTTGPTPDQKSKSCREERGLAGLEETVKSSVAEQTTTAGRSAPALDSVKSTSASKAIPHRVLPPGIKPLPMPEKFDQCGWEDVAEKWQKWEGPQRIRSCELSAEDQAKYQGVLKQIFSVDCVWGIRVAFDPLLVLDVMEKVVHYLESEPTLIEDVPFDVIVVGDIHGQRFYVVSMPAKDGKPGWECQKYVFMGDYVDRGRQQLEVIMALFCIKMLHPDQIFLLRGNHEFIEVNKDYGLVSDLCLRYEKLTARKLFYHINDAFCYLSIAAIIGNTYFCAHAGIAGTRRELRGIYKPLYKAGQDQLVQLMTWSDPAKGLRGQTFNYHRGLASLYGFDALACAMEQMGVKAVLRGHTIMPKGFERTWNCLYTIFSAVAYSDGNAGAVAIIDKEGAISVRVMRVDWTRVEWELELMEADGLPSKNGEDDLTVCDRRGISTE